MYVSHFFYEQNPIVSTIYKEKNSYKLRAKNSTMQQWGDMYLTFIVHDKMQSIYKNALAHPLFL